MQEITLRVSNDLTDDGRVIYSNKASAGFVHWETIAPSDLPNDQISLDDLKRVGIDLVDGKAVRCGEAKVAAGEGK